MSKGKFKRVVMASSVLLFSALAVSSLAGCEIISEQTPVEEEKFGSLTVNNKTSLEAKWIIGDERSVDLSGFDDLGGVLDISTLIKNGKIKITIDDSTVISVNGLKLTALKAGSTKITVSGGGIKIEISVSVVAPDLKSLTLTSSASAGIIGDVITFTVKQTPVNSVITGLTYKIEKDSTGAGTLKDNKLTITKKGSIIVSASVGTIVSNKVTITASLPNLKSINLTATSNGGVIGDEITLTATPNPEIASIEGLKYNIEKSSTGAGTIKDNKLKITKEGTIVVTATVGTIVSNKLTITASLPNLKSLTLRADKTTAILGNEVIFTALPTPEIASIIGLKYEVTSDSTGNGTFDKNVLTITKVGTIKVVAKVKNITSNEVTITASLPALTGINIEANKTNVVINDVVEFTSFASPKDASLSGITYSILKDKSSGSGTINGNKLTVTGEGDILVSAKVGTIESNVVTIKVALPKLTAITLSSDVSSDPRIGNKVTFTSVQSPELASLEGLTYSLLEDSTGAGTFDETNKNELTITKEGTIKVQANVGEIKSNVIEFTAKKPNVTALELKLTSADSTGVIGTTFNFTYEATPETSDASEVSLAILDKSTGKGTIEGNSVTITGAGDVYVVAKVGDVVSNEIKITGTLPELTGLSITSDKASAALHEEVIFTAKASPELADISGIVYSIKEGSTGTGTIESNVLTITGVGTINVIATVGSIVSEPVSITAVLPTVTTITIAADKTEIEDTEKVTFSETFNPTDGDTTGFEYVIDTANSTGTGTISDKVLTVTKAGTIKVYGQIGDLKSNTITITATHIEKCTTSVSTSITNGTVEISPVAGTDIAVGEVTITATPDQSYLLTKVWVKVDGGEETEIIATGTAYKFTTEDRHSYVFGATFTEIEVSTIAAAKTVVDNTMVRVKGKCTYVKNAGSAYIQNGNTGVLVFISSHGMEEGKTYDVYASKDTFNSTVELVKSSTSYIKEITDEITVTETVINDNASATENFVLANSGNKVKVQAKIIALDTSDVTKSGLTTLEVDGKSIKMYRNSNISKDALTGLAVNDFVEINTVISNNYSTIQLLLLSTTTITKTNIAPESIKCVADKPIIQLGKTADLNETITLSTTSTGAWNSSVDASAITYEVSDAGTTGATIAGNVVSATSVGRANVVAKYGDLTSAPVEITVIDPLKAQLVIGAAGDATSVKLGETLQLSALDGRGASVTGATWAVSEESSTIASIDASGLVTGLTAGTATITLTYEGYTSAEFTLSVVDATLTDMVSDPTSVALTVGDADQALTITSDSVAVPDYTMTSGDETICTIVDNKIHAVAAGETDVTVAKSGYNSLVVHVVISAPVVTETTLNLVVADIAKANNWANAKVVTDLPTGDDNVTVSATKGGDLDPKYYVSGTNWRIYTGGNLNITANNGKKIKTIKIVGTAVKLKDSANKAISSDTSIVVDATSVTFTATAGNKITSIEIVYE